MALQFDDPSAYYSPSHDCTDLNDVYEPAANGISLHGEPVDEVRRLPQSAPKVSEWRPLVDKTVSIKVDQAREKGCDQAQHEIDFIKKNAKLVMGTGDDVPTMNDMIFGEHSRLYRTFVDEIPVFDGKHKFFLRCMGTFFLICAMDFTLKELTEFTFVPIDILASKKNTPTFGNSCTTRTTARIARVGLMFLFCAMLRMLLTSVFVSCSLLEWKGKSKCRYQEIHIGERVLLVIRRKLPSKEEDSTQTLLLITCQVMSWK